MPLFYSAPHCKYRPLGYAVAAASLTLLLSACDSDRRETPVVPESAPPTEAEIADVQSPDRDHSITDNTGEATTTAQFGLLNLAVAKIEPTEKYEATGTVRFQPTEDKHAMLVSIDLSGLEPGQHGFHIHENGDCSAPDASSAGGHFNPYETSHGSPDDAKHHLGDLGNIEANNDGQVKVEFESEDLAFSGPASILLKAVVIHAGPDDLRSNPAGKAGDRVGCGIIRKEPDILAEPSQ